jgi:predicted DNA-binding WGR domain protein
MIDKKIINSILTILVGLLVSCNLLQSGDKKSTLIPTKNYFKSDGEIMLKLYKTDNSEIQYWETWSTDKKNAVIHWGKLGELGQFIEIQKSSSTELQNEINKRIEAKMKEEFKEVPYDEQYTLRINFILKTWGTTKDLDRREEVRNIVTENLGWTGNGRCDDGDIGSGEMSLFADVIDPHIAIKTLTTEFKDKNITEEFYFTITKGDNTIEDNIKPE